MNEIKRNKKAKLPNGAVILAERHLDADTNLIVAYYPIANHHYVFWRMNIKDRSCYYGYYHRQIGNTFNLFVNHVNPIQFNLFDSLNIECVKETNKGEFDKCSIEDKPDLYSLYGRLKDRTVNCISDHYSLFDLYQFATWFSDSYNKSIEKQSLIDELFKVLK